MMIERLWQRIQNFVAPAKLMIADDSGPVMRAQIKISYLETRDGVPVVQEFGFSSVPPAGSDVIAVYVSGDRSNGAVVATGHQATRPTGKQPGESVLYNAFGMTIYLTQDGIVINGGGKPITFTNCPTILQNGDIHATGQVIQGYGSADQVSLGTHRHGTGTAAAGTVSPTAGT
ncbi:phage baseplate assembly protein V [Rhodopila sp.]|uniref:phage baseplate assembly protein V n=1 Tax=Rhodopila sp. TaxID=2480087 RepID=UPI003D0C535A